MERIFKTYMNHFGWEVFLKQLPFDLSVISTEQFIATWGHRLKEDSKNEKFQTFKCRVRVGEQTSTYFVSMDGQLFCWMKRND
jgi:hypothetical protein